MPAKITDEQRKAVLQLLAEGQDRDTIASKVGVTPGQVSAVNAHVKMGTYSLPDLSAKVTSGAGKGSPPPKAELPRTLNLLTQMQALRTSTVRQRGSPGRVLLGIDARQEEEVFWNPDPGSGSANPHVLVLGESGFGKTYAVSCLIAELALQGVHSIIFDYGQGFTTETLPPEFIKATSPVEIHASRDGVDINPLQIFPADVHGPINVAQRLADTFARVYPRIGVQQHALLRQAILDVMADEGIFAESESSWIRDLPAFESVHHKLSFYASNRSGGQGRLAGITGSHISTLFVFNTFRPSGRKLSWSELLSSEDKVVLIQLKGLETSLERAVTELLLWNLIGYFEALGPSPLRCFIVLDEAHKLSFDVGSPVEKLLREGRKFGVGIILASQQPEDFSPVAYANTATKIVFQVGDERNFVSRQLSRKLRNEERSESISKLITKLPRGCAYVVSENIGRVVNISSHSSRINH